MRERRKEKAKEKETEELYLESAVVVLGRPEFLVESFDIIHPAHRGNLRLQRQSNTVCVRTTERKANQNGVTQLN